MKDKEKAALLKDTIYRLYSKEGRSKTYIGELLGVNRKVVSDCIKEWDFPEAVHKRRLKPSNQKFLNSHRHEIKLALDRDMSVTELAQKLNVSRKYLYTIINADDTLTKALKDKSKRAALRKEASIENLKIKSSRDYFYEEIDGEEWRPVLGHEEYDVSNMGRVRSKSETYGCYYLIKPSLNKKVGRIYVMLNKGEKRKNVSLHRLVAHAFCENYSEENNTVNHKDGNVFNNKAENLEWVSQGENNKHSYETLRRNKVRGRRMDFDRIIYKDKYEFKSVAAFSRFIGKSETQTRRYIEESPEQHEIKTVKDCND